MQNPDKTEKTRLKYRPGEFEPSRDAQQADNYEFKQQPMQPMNYAQLGAYDNHQFNVPGMQFYQKVQPSHYPPELYAVPYGNFVQPMVPDYYGYASSMYGHAQQMPLGMDYYDPNQHHAAMQRPIEQEQFVKVDTIILGDKK